MQKNGTRIVHKRKITSEIPAVDLELAILQLDRETLIEVVKFGDRQRSLCSSNNPKGFDLIEMNGWTARGLRDQMCGETWVKSEHKNQPGIENPELKVRVIPCNFDQHCGSLNRDPTNVSTKGSASKKNAACNGTGWLFDPDPYSKFDPDAGYGTWVLGTYFCQDTQRLFAELSFPDSFENGQYTSFKHRIILLSGFEPSAELKDDEGKNGPTEYVDIPVLRK